jgi:recombination protein RecT
MNDIVAFKREFDTLAAGGELPVSKDIPIEKMKSALMVAVQKNPMLLSADRSSLWQSIRMCAADGLLPDGREAAMVIYKTKKGDIWVDSVQYIPMVFGLRKRAMKSGEVADIREYLVYEGEWTSGRFEYLAGDEEAITHKPIIDGAPGEPERGEVIGGYAIAVMKDGAKIRHWMSVRDIDKRRRASPSQRVYVKGKAPVVSEEPLGVWRDWTEEQQRKTLVRGLAKKLPLSADDMRGVMESDHDFDGVVIDQAPKKPTLVDKLKAAQLPPAEEDQSQGVEVEEVSQDVDDAETVPVYDVELVFPMEAAFDEGVRAAKEGVTEDSNPYNANPEYSNWIGGHRGAMGAKT